MRVVFPDDQLEHTRRLLLSDAPNEAAAVAVAGQTRTAASEALLVREVHPVPLSSYIEQSPSRAVVSPVFIAPLLKRARSEGWSLVFIHSHPFSKSIANFSAVDDAGEALLMPSLFARAPERPHGSLVLARAGEAARIWPKPQADQCAVAEVVECGAHFRLHGLGDDVRDPAVASEFDRSIRAFGIDGQRAIERLRFAVVGLGGTGSFVAEQLAHLGIRDLLLVDPDRIESTNLNRVVGSKPTSVGRHKVDVACEHVHEVRPATACTAVVGDVVEQRIARTVLGADLVFCCTDSHGSRYVLNQLAYQFMKPVIDLGVTVDARDKRVARISGRVQLLAPGLPCLTCQNLLDPEQVRRDLLSEEDRKRDPYIQGAHEPQPAVISLNGTVASMAVTMMLATVTNLPSEARHQVFIGDRGIVRSVESRPTEGCVVCSLRGAFGRGDLYPIPGRFS